jgi:hypothetical protein
MEKKNPAVQAAQKVDASVRTLSSGVRIRINSVPQLLIDDAVNMVPEPQVPYFHDEERGYEIPNPNDPRYLSLLAAYERAQAQAAVDAAVIWGVELVDEVPDESEWLPKLKFFAKRGRLDLSQYDLENPLEREFVFKRYCALSAGELSELLPDMIAGVTEEDVQKARESFQGD